MLLRDIIISLFIVGIIVSGAGVIVGDFNDNYNVNTSTSFTDTYDQIDEMQERTENIGNKLTQNQGILTTISVALVDGTWYVFQQVIGSVDFITTMIGDLSEEIGLPQWFSVSLAGIILITVLFLVVGAVFNREV